MESNEFLEIVERIEGLKSHIEKLKPSSIPSPYQSEQVNELYQSLAQAQSKLPAITNNKMNPWFDTPFVDIFEISRIIYPVLGQEGLSIIQQTRVTQDGSTALYTRLCHASGQWTESRVRVIPPKNDIDSYRSTLNALRSSSLLSLLGLGVKNDPLDDDGEIAMIEARAGLAKGPSAKSLESKKQDVQVITKEQRQEIEYEMGDFVDLAEEIMDRCHVRSLSDIPQSQFRNALTFIRKNVRAREGKDKK